MTHVLAVYAVQEHIAELMAEASANRLARTQRSPEKQGLAASLIGFARNLFGSREARSGAQSPA